MVKGDLDRWILGYLCTLEFEGALEMEHGFFYGVPITLLELSKHRIRD